MKNTKRLPRALPTGSSFDIIDFTDSLHGLVAQWIRAFPSEGKGRWFDSSRGHHSTCPQKRIRSWSMTASAMPVQHI